MRTLSPVPPRSSVSESNIEKDLATCSQVYLRYDRVRRLFEPPYEGPFRVISRGTKTFRIHRGTREEVVSVDRLKAAVQDEPCGTLTLAPSPSHIFPHVRYHKRPPQTSSTLQPRSITTLLLGNLYISSTVVGTFIFLIS
ncbi:unnamed protein product [Schistocephalus solidus]|uniref:Uncharacterized protein n=1 Tax=Schistocephalus solidus TaxID=70667 RepID=A0A183SLB1_SCHSO|nr:unnamed protein product [Schistocephalus solidus]